MQQDGGKINLGKVCTYLHHFFDTKDCTVKMSGRNCSSDLPNSHKKDKGLGCFCLAAQQGASQFDCQLAGLLGCLIKSFFLLEPKQSVEMYVSDTLDECQLLKEILFSKAWIILTHFPFRLCIKHTNKRKIQQPTLKNYPKKPAGVKVRFSTWRLSQPNTVWSAVCSSTKESQTQRPTGPVVPLVIRGGGEIKRGQVSPSVSLKGQHGLRNQAPAEKILTIIVISKTKYSCKSKARENILLLSLTVDSVYYITHSSWGLIRVEFPHTVRKERSILKPYRRWNSFGESHSKHNETSNLLKWSGWKYVL